MDAVSVESLPLGFRFRPTDAELVNHYLKGKITGRIKSEIEVIPEIDVCKCEPWDVPGDHSPFRSQFLLLPSRSCCQILPFVCIGPKCLFPLFFRLRKKRFFVHALISPRGFVRNIQFRIWHCVQSFAFQHCFCL